MTLTARLERVLSLFNASRLHRDISLWDVEREVVQDAGVFHPFFEACAMFMQETKSDAAVATAQHKATQEEKLIESVNALSPTDFTQHLFSPAVCSKIESLLAEKTGLPFKPSLLF